MTARAFALGLLVALCVSRAAPLAAQPTEVDIDTAQRAQTIDGFGTCLYGTEAQAAWWQALYFDDLRASIARIDITPQFKSPYSDFSYNSPGAHGRPGLPGPDGNNVRAYADASDYGKAWAGRRAAIAVMGPDIDKNSEYFDFDQAKAQTAGAVARAGRDKQAELGDFKLLASLWSPAPWLKHSSGHSIGAPIGDKPKAGSAWPFIWNGNFAGGELDTSGTPRAEFDDTSLGGNGPTSALTQFARGLAAYLRGFQRRFGVNLYAISLQNELGFEQYYSSCAYPQAGAYIAALKAARHELDRYADLRAIRIIGPEDVMGEDGYGMWEYGAGAQHKNLQYLARVFADPEAARALDTVCIHGYAPDGVSAAGAEPKLWQYWVNGWNEAPAAGLPARVNGFAKYGKKSWMTETSGEQAAWLAPSTGFPGDGAFSIAIKLHEALTAGRQSAWLYWQLTDARGPSKEALTDASAREGSPKYVAAKHFFRYIRPGAVRVEATVRGDRSLLASAYLHERDKTLTVVLVNTSQTATTVTLHLFKPGNATADPADLYTSHEGSHFEHAQQALTQGTAAISLPGYAVVTVHTQNVPTQPAIAAATPPRAAARASSGCGCYIAHGSRRSAPAQTACGLIALVLALALGRHKRRHAFRSGLVESARVAYAGRVSDGAAVLDDWLGTEDQRDAPAAALRQRWFEKSAATDAHITSAFGADIERALRGELSAWTASARGRLALVILLDQFTRNVHRNSARAFAGDATALALALKGLELQQERTLKAAERFFLYMPLVHSERLADQERAVALFDDLARAAPLLDARTWAKAHHDIIARFGRFPHRNLVLGRTSTAEEIEFLSQPGSAF